MIKAVIFDMDGTLLNTLYDLYLSTNYALLKFNFKERSIEQVRKFIGDGVRKLIERAVEENADSKTIEECLKVFKEHYSKNMYNNTSIYEGIEEVLKKLKEKNIKTAVVSNKFDGAIKQLSSKYFKNLIDISIGQSDTIAKKPSPESVFEVMKQLNVKKEEVIFIGDSDVDILTAKNAEIKSIGVLWGYRDIEALGGADYIVSKPDEILKIVLGY